MPWISLCALDELTEGRGKYVEIEGFGLAVFLSNGVPATLDNTCPHAGASLADGEIENGCAVCPRHFWAFRLDNGQMRDLPGVAVKAYATRLLEHQGKTLVQADLPIF
jgi:nitrite reductase/ring-hydroxylating ferredoxin subunit